jgi:hypothetical protein
VTWFSLRVEAPAHRDEAVAALFAAGAQGVHEDGTALVTSFPDEAAARAAGTAATVADPLATFEVQPAITVDWSPQRDHAKVDVRRADYARGWPAHRPGADHRH